MDRKLKFHKAFQEKGGLAIIPPVNHLYNAMLLSCHDIVITKIRHQSNLPFPIIDFISSSKLNASATKYNGEYFIGVNWGTLGILQNISLRMLSSNNTFHWIGDQSNERETQKIHNHKHNDYELIKWRIGDEDITPKNRIRLIASYVMLENMLKFILAHEYAHVINGHIDLINHLSSSSNEILDEIGHTKLSPLKKQTLEMDADCIAVNFFLRDWVNGSSFIGLSNLLSTKFRKEPVEVFGDKEFSLKLFIASILIFFRIMEPYKELGEDLNSATHPTAYLRNHFVFETIKPYMVSRGWPDLLGIFERVFPNIRLDVISAFNEITSGTASPFRNGELNNEEQSHVNLLLNEWKEVRKMLEPFAIHNTLAD